MERPNHDLTEKLLRLEALLRRGQICRFREMGPFGDPLRGQGRILSILKMQPQISQRELSYLLDMRQQSLSELLKKLESRGFIQRTPSEDDRRVVMITLTEEGKQAAEDAGEPTFRTDSIFDCLSEEELRLFEGILDRLTASLEEALDLAEERLRGAGKAMWGDGRFEFGYGPGHVWGEYHHGGRHHHDGDGSVPPRHGRWFYPGESDEEE